MIFRFLLGWLLGAGLVYLVAAGLDARVNYALLSGWWCAVTLTRGVKGTRMGWLIAVTAALVVSAYNLIVNLEARELNGSSLFLFMAGAIFVISPLVAALVLDLLLRVFSSSKGKTGAS
mgnify:CR=1 FL=1